MKTLMVIRYAAWTILAALAFLTAAIALGWWRVDGPGRAQTDGGVEIKGLPQIGGPFTLVNQHGKIVSNKDFLGKPKLVFFGFTHCPDVCPTTLFEITTRLQKLGTEASDLQVLFITADPERDTPEQLALYLQSFDPRIVALTGTQEQVDAAVLAYKAYAKKVPSEGGGYTMDHTASVFLMDRNDRFMGLIDYHEQEASALAKMRRLIAK